jgi:hypothetical protein
MGTSKSAAEFSRKLVQAATITETRAKASIQQGALTAKTVVLAEAGSKGLSPGSRIAGGKWGVRYDVKGTGSNPTALLKVTGAFHLVESDTKAHPIYRKGQRAKGRGSTRANRQQALAEAFGGTGAYTGGSLRLADGSFRKVVHHPGTKGKGIWKAAKPKIERAVPTVMAQRIIGGWREAFR